MPQEQKKIPSRTSPSPGFFERLFGTSEMTPEMLEGIEIARKEMPDMGEVESYGPISRLFMSGANAYTSPGRKIYLNPKTLQGHQPQEVADTLTHEQKHVEQMNQRGTNPVTEILSGSIFGRGLNPSEPYHRRPDEMEAFQAEEERRRNMGRGGSTAIPSFLTGEFYTPRDTKLHAPDDIMSIANRQKRLGIGGGGR